MRRAVAGAKHILAATAPLTLVAVRGVREQAQDGKKGDTRRRMTSHVFTDPIADVALHDLTETNLVDWRARRPAHLAASTVKRIITDLKAALNAAARAHRRKLPPDFTTTVKHGLTGVASNDPVARDGAALPDAEVRRIIEAAKAVDEEDGWGGDLLRLVLVLAATGARFSQAARLRVGDLQIAQNRLMVPTSRKGRSSGKSASVGVRIGSDIVDLLRPAAAGGNRASSSSNAGVTGGKGLYGSATGVAHGAMPPNCSGHGKDRQACPPARQRNALQFAAFQYRPHAA